MAEASAMHTLVRLRPPLSCQSSSSRRRVRNGVEQRYLSERDSVQRWLQRRDVDN